MRYLALTALVTASCSTSSISTEEKQCRQSILSREVSPELIDFVGFQPIDRSDMISRLQDKMGSDPADPESFWASKNEAIAAVDEAAKEGAVFSVVTLRGGRLGEGERELLCIATPGYCECG